MNLDNLMECFEQVLAYAGKPAGYKLGRIVDSALKNHGKLTRRDNEAVVNLLAEAFRSRFSADLQHDSSVHSEAREYGYVRAAKNHPAMHELQRIGYYGNRASQLLIAEYRSKDNIGPGSQALIRLKRFADKELAEEILKHGFEEWLSGDSLIRRKRRIIIKLLKQAVDFQVSGMLVGDKQFADTVHQYGYVYAISNSELADELLKIEPFGRQVLKEILREFRHKDSVKTARQNRNARTTKNRQREFKPMRSSERRRLRRQAKSMARRENAKASQKRKLQKVRQRPFDLVLVSEKYVQLERDVFDPLITGVKPKAGCGNSMSFSLHLGKYIGGELVGSEPSLVGGKYVGGTDLRIICRWNKKAYGQQALRFKIKRRKSSSGQCITWTRSEVRNIEHLPFELQWLLKQTLHSSAPHLVADIPKNILHFAI